MDAQRDDKRNPRDAANDEEAEADRGVTAQESDGTETQEGDIARSDQ